MTVELTTVFADPSDPDEFERRYVHHHDTAVAASETEAGAAVGGDAFEIGTGGVEFLLSDVESA